MTDVRPRLSLGRFSCAPTYALILEVVGASSRGLLSTRRRAKISCIKRAALQQIASETNGEAAVSAHVQNGTLIKGFTKVRGSPVLNLVSKHGQQGPLEGGTMAYPGASVIGGAKNPQVTGLSDVTVFHSYFPN